MREQRIAISAVESTAVQEAGRRKQPEQASRQNGLDRPYRDHSGGLDKAYKGPLKNCFKGLLEAF